MSDFEYLDIADKRMVLVKRKQILLLFVPLFIFACTLPDFVLPTPVVPQTASPTVSPVLPTEIPSQTPFVPTETPTLTPTVPPSPTPTLGPAMFTSNTSANCRQGPSTAYPILKGLSPSESVPVIGKTTPDRVLWWLVEKNNTQCWVWSDLGSTSGDFSGISAIPAPPVPTPSRHHVDVLFENNTDADICKMNFYVGIDIVAAFSWKKREFRNEGTDKIISLPKGRYDLIEAYNCKSKRAAALINIVINEDNNAFSLTQLPK